MARQHKATHIVVAAHERRGGHIPLDQLLACRLAGIQVLDLLNFYEQELGLIRLQYLRTGWLVYGDGFTQGPTRAIIKRLFDVAVASALLLVAAPVMLVTGGGDPAGDRKADILPAGAGLRAGAVIRHPEIPLDGAGCREGWSALGQHR